jgi:hypothetical protein
VRRLQRAELFDHQEPEDHDGASGAEKVLPHLPQAHAAQGSEVIDELSDFRIDELKFENPSILQFCNQQGRKLNG